MPFPAAFVDAADRDLHFSCPKVNFLGLTSQEQKDAAEYWPVAGGWWFLLEVSGRAWTRPHRGAETRNRL